jgi:hypothetical protein
MYMNGSNEMTHVTGPLVIEFIHNYNVNVWFALSNYTNYQTSSN